MYVKCNNSEFLTWFEGDFFKIKEISGATSFQPCEPKEERNINTNLLYILGRSVVKRFLYIEFDFENSTLTINNKTYNVLINYEFTYKKTRGNNILAYNGLKGLYSFILDSMNIKESPFSITTLDFLEKLA